MNVEVAYAVSRFVAASIACEFIRYWYPSSNFPAPNARVHGLEPEIPMFVNPGFPAPQLFDTAWKYCPSERHSRKETSVTPVGYPAPAGSADVPLTTGSALLTFAPFAGRLTCETGAVLS